MTRLADLAKIHIGAAELGWRSPDDDAEYRRQLFAVCRVKTASDLDEPGRLRFIAHMRQCGWRPRPGRKVRKMAGSATAGQLSLIRHLWARLAAAGQVRHGDESALRRWVRGQTGGQVDAPEFLDRRAAASLTERLKLWCARLSIDWENGQ